MKKILFFLLKMMSLPMLVTASSIDSIPPQNLWGHITFVLRSPPMSWDNVIVWWDSDLDGTVSDNDNHTTISFLTTMQWRDCIDDYRESGYDGHNKQMAITFKRNPYFREGQPEERRYIVTSNY